MAEAPDRPRRVTRTDVARYAGVSAAVVSYVVNGGPRGVADQTASRVREAMQALSYEPNLAARALRRGTTQTLGLVLIDNVGAFYTELGIAIEREASTRGYRMLVAHSYGDPGTEEQLVRDLLGRQVDGLFLVSSLQRSQSNSTASLSSRPTVLLDCPGPIPGRHTIGPNALKGATDAVQHLVRIHKKESVGLIVGRGFATPDPREQGWQQALQDSGLPRGPVVVADWTNEGGYHAALELLNRGTLPSSLFVSSDNQAAGVLLALHEAGVDVQRECPVISFDGTRSSKYFWPPLTSVRQPVKAMAEQALNLIGDPNTPPMHHTFELELLVRQSCGCSPGNEMAPTVVADVGSQQPGNFNP